MIELLRNVIVLILLSNMLENQAEPTFNRENVFGEFLFNNATSFNKLIKTVHAFIIFVLISSIGGWLELIVNLILIGMLIWGLILKRLNIIVACNCYFTKNISIIFLFNTLILISALCLLLNSISAIEINLGYGVQQEIIVYKISLFFIFSVLLLSRLMRKKTKNAVENISICESSSFLTKNGKPIRFSELESKSNLSIFIAFQENCFACNQLKPILFRLSEAYKMEVSFYFLETNLSTINTDCYLVNKEFLQTISPKGFPCGFLYLHSESRVLGDVKTGVNEIMEMLTRVLSKI